MLSTDNVFQLINYTQFVESFFWGVSVAGLLYLRYKEPNRERPIKVNMLFHNKAKVSIKVNKSPTKKKKTDQGEQVHN